MNRNRRAALDHASCERMGIGMHEDNEDDEGKSSDKVNGRKAASI